MMIDRCTLLKGLAAAPAAAAAATLIDPPAASAAGIELVPDAFKLSYRTATGVGLPSTYPAVISDLQASGSLPWASVDDVVNSANRSGAAHTLNYTGFMQGWMWGGDDQTGEWYPQGITTSADFQETGLYNGRFIMLASWYDHYDQENGKGARISFVNMTDPANPRYRHVLLVEPYVQQYNPAVTVPSFRAIHTHAGSIMWYGKLLYVADTFNGIRVFDTTKMLKVSATGDATTIGLQSDGTYTAHNYQYVLPQVAAYDDVALPDGIPKIRYSCISLDRSTAPDSMVVAEYGEPDKPAKSKAAVPVQPRLHRPPAEHGHRQQGVPN